MDRGTGGWGHNRQHDELSIHGDLTCSKSRKWVATDWYTLSNPLKNHLNINAVHFFEIEIGNNKQAPKNSTFLGTFVISVNSDYLGKGYAGYKTQMRKNARLI